MTRKLIVGVVGGSRKPRTMSQSEWETVLQLATKVGEMVAACHCSILTGATLGKGTGRVNGNAMRAAVHKDGFAIGILPVSARHHSREACVVLDSLKGVLEVRTNMSSARRNYINGLTPDVLIALAGGSGTASEVKIALHVGRPVIFLKSRDFLSKLPTEAVRKKLEMVNTGVRPYIDAEHVLAQELIGFECNDTDAVKAKISELQSNVGNDTTYYPMDVEGAPDKDQFETAFMKYTELTV